jgi:hypothetical protein
MRSNIGRLRYGRTLPDRHSSRYAWLNWNSVERHGTLEFRLWPGSLCALKIESFARLSWLAVQAASRRGRGILPRSWAEYLASLPSDLRDFAIVRAWRFRGRPEDAPCGLNGRVLSASEMIETYGNSAVALAAFDGMAGPQNSERGTAIRELVARRKARLVREAAAAVHAAQAAAEVEVSRV